MENTFNDKQKRSILKPGDVLFNIVGASIGRAAIFELDVLANINQAVCIIRLKSNLSQKYLSYYLNSNLAKQHYEKYIVDVARANLSLSVISDLPIPICDLQEQNAITQELDLKFTIIDNLSDTVKRHLQLLKVLRFSVLKKAFTGNLVAGRQNELSIPSLIEKLQIEMVAAKDQRSKKAINSPKLLKMKVSLLEAIRQNFEIKQFTFDELRNKLLMSYEDIKDQLFDLLDEDKLLSEFNPKTKKVTFKLKHEN